MVERRLFFKSGQWPQTRPGTGQRLLGGKMETQNYQYRGYEIQITHTPPLWQAAIYASDSNLPAVVGRWSLSAPPMSGRRKWKPIGCIVGAGSVVSADVPAGCTDNLSFHLVAPAGMAPLIRISGLASYAFRDLGTNRKRDVFASTGTPGL